MTILYYEEPTLVQRGWSVKGIRLYIGKPDRVLGCKNCYSQARVLKSEEFLRRTNNEHLKGLS
jgi:hypothetical protein